MLAEYNALIHLKYLNQCSPEIPFQRLTLRLGQIILAKESLLVQYPLIHNPSRLTTIPKRLRDELLETSCDILELSENIIDDPTISSWTSVSRSYVHLHPITFLLNELCTTPEHPQAKRAWNAFDKAYTRQLRLSPEANHAIWRPLQSLHAKAKLAAEQTSPCKAFEDVPTLSDILDQDCDMPSTGPLNTLTDQLHDKSPSIDLGPSDEAMMAFDLQNSLVMVENSHVQFDVDSSWWLATDPADSVPY